MKQLLFFTLPALILLSCKKSDTVNTEEVRLLQTKQQDGNGDLHTTILDYDAQGRIVRISSKKNNDVPELRATISYPGSEVHVAEPTISNAASSHTREIKFVLDGSNKPLTRIELRTNEYFAPASNPQRDFYTDTATYSYDASGLLTKKTGRSRDSTWFNPGYVQTSVRSNTYTATYTNVNGNLAEMTRVSAENYRSAIGSNTYSSSSSMEEKNTFDYSRAYANSTDFKHAFLLEEFAVILPDYPLNKNYRNLPNQVTSSRVEKNGTGAVVDNSSGSSTMTYSFNKYGFLSMIGDNPNRVQNKELIYSH
jgi:hypothetical protein